MTCTALTPAVEILGEDAFERVQPEWESLMGRTYDNRVFLTPTWHQIWWRHFGSGEAYLITARDDDGMLVGILPVQIRERDGRRLLTLTGDPSVTDYMDGLAEKERSTEILSELWSQAVTRFECDLIELRHVPSSSPLFLALHRLYPGAFSVADDQVCPVALLCSTWDGYLQMLTKKQRHEIRRKVRRAQEGVEWSWRTVGSPNELTRDMETFFRLHEQSAQDKARFMTHEIRGFFSDVAGAFLDRGWLRLAIFNRDGEDVAATLSFLYRERYLLYNSGYDPSQAAHNPGIAAIAHAMQDAVDEKAVVFDFLSGDEPYKYQFGATNTRTCRATVVL